MKHVHHDMIVEWAKDTSRVVEVYSDPLDCWSPVASPTWNPDCKYRFKPVEPKYIVVNGMYVQVPVRGGLVDGQSYWIANPMVADRALKYVWEDDADDRRWLSFGLVHLTKEAAQAHIDAMLLPSRSDK